jgi:hypothetical protein
VWDTTIRFLELLLKYLTDDDVCEKVLQFWIIPIMEEKLNLAYEKLDELLAVHKDHPMTTNGHFINNSKKTMQDGAIDNLEMTLKREGQKSGGVVSIHDITRIMSSMKSISIADMDMVAAEEALDNMNAFYEVYPVSYIQ